MADSKKRRVRIDDLPKSAVVSEEEMKHLRGGILIGLLLPAVQKVRETDGIVDAADYLVWR